MELSVIIVNWNTKDLLLECLKSIFQEAEASETEVFVVDNGSNDGSEEAVRAEFPAAVLIDNPLNVGFARANNQALKLSHGKYFLLLNPDTRVRKGAVKNLVAFMNLHPKAGVAGPQLLNSDGSRQNSIANFPSLATELLNKRLLRWVFPKQFPGKEMHYTEPIEVDSVIGACMMVRRAATDQVGFLDEDYFLFLEETDWCYRMKRAGWQVFHVPQAEIVHFQGKSAEQDKKRAKVEYYRSRYQFFRKHRGKLQHSLLLIGLTAKLGIEFFLMLIGCLVSLFTVRRWRRKLSIYSYLLRWHLRLCPAGTGLGKE